ncbi:MAG: hypothetical protein ACXQTL_06115 [Methanosarcinales archaeon]
MEGTRGSDLVDELSAEIEYWRSLWQFVVSSAEGWMVYQVHSRLTAQDLKEWLEDRKRRFDRKT